MTYHDSNPNMNARIVLIVISVFSWGTLILGGLIAAAPEGIYYSYIFVVIFFSCQLIIVLYLSVCTIKVIGMKYAVSHFILFLALVPLLGIGFVIPFLMYRDYKKTMATRE